MALAREATIKIGLAVVTLVVLLMAMDMLLFFGENQLLGDVLQIETQYYYFLLLLLMPFTFLIYSIRPVLDWLFASCSILVLAVFVVTAEESLDNAWEFGAPGWITVLCLMLWLMILEALRRSAGLVLCLIAAVFSCLPLFTDLLPGPLSGLSSSWHETAAYHLLSIESVFGLPFRAFANLVIGFIFFGVVLQKTGGGRFFLDLAFSLMGSQRGGSAKVAIFSSGLMGSMSGSVVTNVMTTGQLTIPAMKKSGMTGEVAGSIEACASTGGVLLPPIMGSTAFVMASFLDIPYAEVAVAAFLPALLYFFSLFVQIDSYAGRQKLRGASAEELPSLVSVIKSGWHYLGAFALLIFLLLVLKQEAIAPYYASLALLALSFFSGDQKMDGPKFFDLLVSVGKLLVELVVMLAGVGLIVGSLSVTGLSGTLVNDLLAIAGDDLFLLLIMGALTSFVLGIGMTVTAAYIFLAIVLAPALVGQSLNPLAAHLFILYWAMLSYITPPVALGAYSAASISQASPIATGFMAMRMGSVLYVTPFIFVLDNGFLLIGSVPNILQVVLEAFLGVWLVAGALQGFLPLYGVMSNIFARTIVLLGGLLIAVPGLSLFEVSAVDNLDLALIGCLFFGAGIMFDRLVRRVEA